MRSRQRQARTGASRTPSQRGEATGERSSRRGKQPRTLDRGLRNALVAAIFAVAAGIAFGPALHAPFDFDDYPAIVHNATIQSFSPPWAPLHSPPLGTPASGRPAANVSFAISYALNELLGIDQATIAADRASSVDTRNAAFGFRLANVVLHVVAALLLFAAVRLTLQIGRVPDEFRELAIPVAFVVALIWLIHPLQTEAVDYVSQRTEILVSLCYLATIYAAMRHWELVAAPDVDRDNTDGRAGRRWFALAAISSLIGMASKEVMLTAPFVVALHDRAFLSDNWRNLWTNRPRRWLYITLLATTALAIALILSGGRAATVGLDVGITPRDYLITQGWAIPHYLRLALLPDALTYDYGQTPILGATSVAGLCLLTALGAGVVWCWTKPRWRWLGFLGAMFFLLLAPSSSIVPIRTEVAAERRMYLALVAIVVLVVVVAMRLIRARRGRLAAVVVVAIALLATAANRSASYRHPTKLWQDALAKFPSNARGYDAVGAAMMREQPPRSDAADSMFALAIAHDSSYLRPWLRRGAIALKEGRFPDAERYLLHVLQVAPEDSDATSNLGKVYLAAGQPQRAIPLLRRVAERTTDPTALTDLGNAYFLSGQTDSAITTLRQATIDNSRDTAAFNWLGAALVEVGRGAEAIAPLEHSVALDPNAGFAFGLLSIASAQANDSAAAIRAAAKAVERAHGDAGVLLFAGRGLEIAHRPDLARQSYGEAVSLEPSNPEALTRLAIVEAARGDVSSAVRLLNQALRSAPNYPPALKTLAALRAK